MQLSGKKILLGITGSIAAYKSVELVRLFVKEGAEVRVVMTPSAHQFVTALSLATVSKNPVLTSFANDQDGTWNNHVELGLWADLFLVAPASANTLAKFSYGLCDNLLTAVYLSAKCPVYAAPAMDLDMWQHPSTTENFARLKKAGVHFVGPAVGELASGLSGEGRMEEPEIIFAHALLALSTRKDFSGMKVLVSAGPTHEAIDPVRYISNHSSGKMGYAIADEFASRGAAVTLVAGPGNQKTLHPSVKVIPVISADEMYDKCISAFSKCHIAVMAAAVADFTPLKKSKSKIKKGVAAALPDIRLKPTRDILASMGKKKKKNQWLIGFALETDHELDHAIQKLKNKNLDLIVLNSMRDEGSGFNFDTNKITLISRNLKTTALPLKPKSEAATDIVNHLYQLMHA